MPGADQRRPAAADRLDVIIGPLVCEDVAGLVGYAWQHAAASAVIPMINKGDRGDSRLRRADRLITGGGRGIGWAAAVGLADAGASLVLVARSASQLAETRDLAVARGARPGQVM